MTQAAGAIEVPWKDWLRRWDDQQCVYIQDRERAFEVMSSFLEALLPELITVLDLAAGAGSVSRRLLDRRPAARAVAVDVDPVLLTLGQRALGDMDGRLRWVRADLRDPEWTNLVGEDGFDAVLSSTALHWLEPDALAAVYRDARKLLRPGGILLNHDSLYHPRHTRIREAVQAIDRQRQERAVRGGAEAWADWWDALRAEPALREAFAERDAIFERPTGRIFPDQARPGPPRTTPSLAFHEAALLEAGFDEVGTVWQDLHKRILLGLA